MKIAPKTLLVLLLYLALSMGCRFGPEGGEKQESSPGIDTPSERTKDSSQHIKSNDPSLPEVRFPKESKKKSAADLDTLRPIKA